MAKRRSALALDFGYLFGIPSMIVSTFIFTREYWIAAVIFGLFFLALLKKRQLYFTLPKSARYVICAYPALLLAVISVTFVTEFTGKSFLWFMLFLVVYASVLIVISFIVLAAEDEAAKAAGTNVKNGEKNWPGFISGLVAIPTMYCCSMLAMGKWYLAVPALLLVIPILLLKGVTREFAHFPVLTRILILGMPLPLLASWVIYYFQYGAAINFILILSLFVIHVISNHQMKNVYRDRAAHK